MQVLGRFGQVGELVLTYTHVLLQDISFSTFIAHVWAITVAPITGPVTLCKGDDDVGGGYKGMLQNMLKVIKNS